MDLKKVIACFAVFAPAEIRRPYARLIANPTKKHATKFVSACIPRRDEVSATLLVAGIDECEALGCPEEAVRLAVTGPAIACAFLTGKNFAASMSKHIAGHCRPGGR